MHRPQEPWPLADQPGTNLLHPKADRYDAQAEFRVTLTGAVSAGGTFVASERDGDASGTSWLTRRAARTSGEEISC
ncbi:hypothetical protein [Streptomyces sp. NPDC003832]